MRRRNIPEVGANRLKWLFSRSLVRTVLLNLSIVLLVISLLTPIYIMTIDNTRASVQMEITRGLRGQLNTFSANIEELSRSAYLVAENRSFAYLAYIPDENGLHITKAVSLWSGIRQSFLNYGILVDDYALLFKNSTYVITGNGVVNRKNYYGAGLSFEGLTQAEYEKLLFEDKCACITARRVSSRVIGTDKEAIALNFYSPNTASVYYVVSVIIKRDTLEKAVTNQTVRDNGSLCLYNGATGELLFSIGETNKRDPIKISSDNGAFYLTYDVNDGIFVRETRNVFLIIVGYCLAAFLLAVLYSVLLNTRYIRSFHKITTIMESSSLLMNEDAENYKNLMDYACRFLSSSTLYTRKLEMDLTHMQERYRNELIFGALRGTHAINAEEKLFFRDYKVFSGAYRVVEVIAQDEKTVTIGMQNEISELFKEYLIKYMPTGYIVMESPLIALLSDQNNTLPFLENVGREASVHIAPVSVLISEVGEGMDDLNRLYERVDFLRQNRTLFAEKGDTIVRYKDMPTGYAETDPPSLETWDALSRAVGNGTVETLEDCLQNVHKALEVCAAEHPVRLPYLYYSILQIVTVYKRHLKCEESLPEYDAEESLAKTETYLFEQLRAVHAGMKLQRETADPYKEVVAYIDENYLDRNLCLASLAERFSMSNAYLSRMVKLSTGVSYAEYVEQKRMKKAEELLTDTRMNMNDIAAAAGYEYPNTFFKAFKRKYMISPGAYRESISASQSEK